jgi:hypothetical protein
MLGYVRLNQCIVANVKVREIRLVEPDFLIYVILIYLDLIGLFSISLA